MEQNVSRINGGITINVGASVKRITYMKNMFGILLHVIEKMKNILASITDDSAIICDEVIESFDKEIKIIPTHFSEKNKTCKAQDFYILLVYLFIFIALLIAVSMYCYLIKYQAKKKHYYFRT